MISLLDALTLVIASHSSHIEIDHDECGLCRLDLLVSMQAPASTDDLVDYLLWYTGSDVPSAFLPNSSYHFLYCRVSIGCDQGRFKTQSIFSQRIAFRGRSLY